jgi:CheY-like chemotaxis protein
MFIMPNSLNHGKKYPINNFHGHCFNQLRKKSVFVIDDDYVNFLFFKELLTGITEKIFRSVSLSQALKMLTENGDFCMIILSNSIPENFNNFAIRTIKTRYPEIPIISLIHSPSRYVEADLLRAGSNLCISRYTDQDHFIEAFLEVLEFSANAQ